MLEIMQALSIREIDWKLYAGAHKNTLLQSALERPDFAARVHNAQYVGKVGRLSGSLLNEPAFSRHSRTANVVHRSYYPVIDLQPTGLPVLLTLYDMWDERAGSNARRLDSIKSVLKKRAVARADRVICISQSTRRELIELWPWADSKTFVVPLGVRRLAFVPRPASQGRPYFLFVGARGGYKNAEILLTALSASMLKDHDLLCVGGGSFSSNEIARHALVGLTGRVIQLDADDANLASLYENATALLYPSMYEGFGLPLLEAMIHGCPVVAAPLTSLPEVGGDVALYAGADEPDAWVSAMVLLASDDNVRKERGRRGRAWADRFSWEATAEAYDVHYRAML